MNTRRFFTGLMILVALAALGRHGLVAQSVSPPELAQIKAQAEAQYDDGSFAKANALYLQAQRLELSPSDARWVSFRLADTSWRSQASTNTFDSTILDNAARELESLIRSVERVEDRDIVWAEASESLGDFWWTRRDQQDWGRAWPHYTNALEFWAGSDQLDLARGRYLDIVWTMADPPWTREHQWLYYQNNIPMNVLDNAATIAVTPEDQSHAHYLIAMALRQQGDWASRLRIPREFEAAITAGKSAFWYDDALFAYGEWLATQGPAVMQANGQWRAEPDYNGALALFHRLLREFKKGETRYYDNARNQIEQITSPQLAVGVSNIFLPGSGIQYHLSWRNIKRIDLSMFKVDLTRDLTFAAREKDAMNDWINRIRLDAAEPIHTWIKDTQDKDDHKPGQASERLDEPLPAGAYVIEAASGGKNSRELILVSNTSVTIKTANQRAVAFVCDALSGAPLAGANVRMWRFDSDNNGQWIVGDITKTADDSGLAAFDGGDFGKRISSNPQYLVMVSSGDQQTFAQAWSNSYEPGHEPWKLFAFTDRPAYRPGDSVQWKVIARTWSADGYHTPADQSVEYEVTSPRSEKIAGGSLKLNAFGSAWGSVELGSSTALGEYQIQFWKDKNHNNFIGQATLFRLEEYKLPEFKVNVSTPEENGRKKAFRLGDYVQATVQADYYFGGPVSNASAEVIVYQNPHYHWWMPTRDFSWCYEEPNPWRWQYGGQGQIIKRETLKTDAEGRAVITFETPADSQQDFEYRIEARVIDASRREVVGNGTVRVTRQRYYVHPTPRHNLYQPNDKVEIDITAIDANDQPVQTEGTIRVTREQWREVWADPMGKEVTGDALMKLQSEMAIFPPPPGPGVPSGGWWCKHRGYVSEEVLTTTVKLDKDGEATFSFTPSKDGFYRIAWMSKDADSPMPITAEANVWVTTSATTELGYRTGGVQIIIDTDTVRVGQTTPVMIVTPTNDRHVLFSVEGSDLYDLQVVHVTGTARLVQLPIESKYVPNVWVNAMMAHAAQLHADTKELVVPPVEQYLNVTVTADREQYMPGEEGSFTVNVKDADGKPAQAEVALSVFDEAVTYIQQDIVGDPRQFFFDQRQWNIVQTGSTFNQRAFVKLIKGENDRLIDARLAGIQARNEGKDERGDAKFDDAPELNMDSAMQFGGGGGGGMRGRDQLRMVDGAAPGAPMAVAESAVAGREMLGMAKKSGGGIIGDPVVGQVPGGGGEPPAVQVRSDFRATLLWQPDLITDEDGTAHVKLKYGDSLTTWLANARVAGKGQQFGTASATTRTQMPLIARLQAPRFFLVGDVVRISGVINNNTNDKLTVTPELKAEGLTLMGVIKDGVPSQQAAGAMEIAANSETRVNWQVSVESPGNGEAKLILTARSDKHADAMENTYKVYEHGVERLIAKSGKVRANEVTVKLDIPRERKVESTVLAVQVSPSMAVTMLDSLPYLIGYPYGCTEQTMSRFLPTAITAKTLKDLGVNPETAMNKVFGGIEQQFIDKTHKGGKRDLSKLQEMTNASLERLYDFQHDDGGWGWWKEGNSDRFMTAYVLWGLCLAHQADLDVKLDVIERAAAWLDSQIVEEEFSPDRQAWILHALATHHDVMQQRQIGEFEQTALNNLWARREQLNAYTRALLALSAHGFGDEAKAKTLIANLENGVKRDDRPDASVIIGGGAGAGANDAVIATAHWGEDGFWWRWSDGGVEATAFTLKAILAIDPKNALVEPVTNWLIKNRRGAQWSNTRDTAITVLALNDYLRASGELTPEMEYEVFVNGRSVVTKKLTAEDALSAPSRFTIDREYINDGGNEIRIVRKSGSGPIYFSAEASFFSLEEPIPAAGNEIFARREYYKLVPKPTLLKGYVYDCVPVPDGGSVTSGERVEVVLTIEAKNNYEYLVFEDLKPAGLEAAAIQSGAPVWARQLKSGAVQRTFGDGSRTTDEVMDEQSVSSNEDYTGQTAWVYQELRDRKVAMFIDHLPEGVWEIRYDLRAEVPGRFHALPVLGHAMYVPEIKCNGAETRVTVLESAN